jgi:hypothetical protein
MNCGTEIPANWKGCLNKNECPACSGPIMNESSKGLLDEVREAFKLMANDPEGLAGWLLDNYALTKVGTGEPVNFYGTKQNIAEESNLKVANNPVQQMLKRTGLQKQVNSSKETAMEALARQIQNGEGEEQEIPVEEITEGEEEDETYVPAQKLSQALVSVDTSIVPDKKLKSSFEGAIGGEGEDNEYFNQLRLKKLKAQSQLASKGGGFSRGD